MMKEKWFQPNEETRGFQIKGAKLKSHLWKFFGEHFFHLMIDPFNSMRVLWLRLFGATIGDDCYISSKTIIVDPYKMTIGNKCCFDQYVYVNGSLQVGNNVSLSSYTKIIAGGHDVRSRHFTYYDKPVVIGNSVFVGANSVVRGGVKIGTFSVIGANSFVIKDIPENAVAFGNPAKEQSERIPQNEYDKYDYG